MKYYLMTLCTALFLMSCKKDDDVSPPSMDVGQQDPATNQGRVPCEGGFADGFPCGDYDLMSRVTLSEMNVEGGNDCWGWTDPSSGMEYAIMGLGNGTAFINVSNPEQHGMKVISHLGQQLLNRPSFGNGIFHFICHRKTHLEQNT